jgi:hypothetical protein
MNRPKATRFSQLLSPFVILAFLAIRPIPAHAQNFEWKVSFSAAGRNDTRGPDTISNAVAGGASGVYVGGVTAGVFAGQGSAGSDLDAFVARYDSAGNQIWARQFGSTEDDTVNGVAVDSTGVYVVGTTNGALPGQNSAGSSDIFVKKYDVNGSELWTRQFGVNAEDEGLAIAVDPTGVYVTGHLWGDGVLRKYDLYTGNELWTRLISAGSSARVAGVAVDASGVYITGNSSGALVQPGQGGDDIFVLKYDKNGGIVWTRQFGTDTTDLPNAIAVNASGVYIAGQTVGVLTGQAKAGGLWDAVAAKYDLNGNLQWVRQFGTDGDDAAYGVAVNSTGVFFVGSVFGELPGQTGNTGSDSFLRRYDFNGTEIATNQFGIAGNDEAFGVAAASTGVFISGHAGAIGREATVAKIAPPPSIYYLPHLAFGGGWQTTLTYLNYSASQVSCQTTFLNDAGASLAVPFGGPADAVRTDVLPSYGSIHRQSTADLSAPVLTGWARVQCNGPVKPSILFRYYERNSPTGEASVNASEVPATKFVTFAERRTGIAYANPSSQTAAVRVTAYNASGQSVGSSDFALAPGAHGAAFVESLLGLTNFVGSAQITSTVPIVTLSLNFEAPPVFSSLPPGDIDVTIAPAAQTYYLPHLALGGGWQTTLTYLNYSATPATCQTTFLTDAGAPLPVPFGGAAASSRSDTLAANGSLHIESTANLTTPVQAGWARVQCSAPIKPSILFRSYSQGAPNGEASVNASSIPAGMFVTFGDPRTGVAYANPSSQPAPVSVTVYNTAGQVVRSGSFMIAPAVHGAAFLGSLLGITDFVGSAQVFSSIPIVTLSLNFEASPVFSSLPPGDLTN